MSLTKREAAAVSAYTGILIGSFADLHEYAEEIMGRPIWTHQFPSIADDLKAAARADFMAIQVDGKSAA